MWSSQEQKYRITHMPSEGLNPGLSAAGRIGRLHCSADIDSVNTICVDWHKCERGRLLRGRLHIHSTAAWNFSGYRNIIKKFVWTNKKIWLLHQKRALSPIFHMWQPIQRWLRENMLYPFSLELIKHQSARCEVTATDSGMFGMFVLVAMRCGYFLWWDSSQCATTQASTSFPFH